MDIKAKSASKLDLKAYLEAEKARLEEEIADDVEVPTEEESRVGITNHMADDGTAVFEQERDAGVRRDRELRLIDVENALRRMEEGVYGICERCGRPIDAARLEAMPTTTFCLECQAFQEQRREAGL